MTFLLAILEPIEQPLTALLEWLHASIGLSWVWAIVVLTVLVRIVIVPLTVKQIRSMQKLQVVAPQLKAIQAKYKNDKQRMNEEVMKFYRENKVNPASSCLPILVQIPIFIALFYVLRDFEDEVFPAYQRQGETLADLGWLGIVPSITDNIGVHWSGYFLVVLYVASQMASTVFMATTMDPKQKYIFLALPLVFAYFIVKPPFGATVFPVGLLLYWVTTNLWTVGQGLITRRLVPKPQPPPKRTSRAEPRPGDDGRGGDGAKPSKAAPKPGAPQQRVRRRKKKGPQARR